MELRDSMVQKLSGREASPHRPDRRRRHADNPSIPMTVNLPKHLKERLDTYVLRHGTTRNGVISQALIAWLNTHDNPADDK